MYVAKRGSSGYIVYSPDQDEHGSDRLAFIAELRAAIDRDELVLHYQPKVSLKTGRCVRAEALVRWNHPVRGLIPPDQFVPLAEQTGLIKPLTRWVLGAALRQCRAWRDSGFDLPVAVNLSMLNLHDPELTESVAELLVACGVPPAFLKVEVTESAIMSDPERALETLRCLRGMGVAVAIDDFGTGHSSLNYLKHLPVEDIKLDRSFVREMRVDESDFAIVRSTVQLAHSLDLRVIAEGVEDEETWDLLAALGCDAAQGYYMSRPLPAEDLESWLHDSPWGLPVGSISDDTAGLPVLRRAA
jgi:EAL domain-containing protein (putative c-di-GMP-specific phosphodiesterase class I)